MGGSIGSFNFGQQGQQQQPTSQKGAGSQYPGVPQYNKAPAQYSNPTYAKMLSVNGGAPSFDMIQQLGGYGKPLYLMKQHQEQAVNNRRNDIAGVYNDMLGRQADDEGLNSYLNSGQNADFARNSIAQSPEYMGHQIDLGNAKFDPQYYLNANKDVAANEYFAQHPEEHYRQYGRSENRQAFDPSQSVALAQQLRARKEGNAAAAQNTDLASQVEQLKQQMANMQSNNGSSNDYFGG